MNDCAARMIVHERLRSAAEAASRVIICFNISRQDEARKGIVR